jgi:hypothetical protein
MRKIWIILAWMALVMLPRPAAGADNDPYITHQETNGCCHPAHVEMNLPLSLTSQDPSSSWPGEFPIIVCVGAQITVQGSASTISNALDCVDNVWSNGDRTPGGTAPAQVDHIVLYWQATDGSANTLGWGVGNDDVSGHFSSTTATDGSVEMEIAGVILNPTNSECDYTTGRDKLSQSFAFVGVDSLEAGAEEWDDGDDDPGTRLFLVPWCNSSETVAVTAVPFLTFPNNTCRRVGA